MTLKYALVALLFPAIAAVTTACGPSCTGNEGSSLETACAAWNNGRYERLPTMCGIKGKSGGLGFKWTDGDKSCSCKISRESLTGFYDVTGCTYSGPKMTTSAMSTSSSCGVDWTKKPTCGECMNASCCSSQAACGSNAECLAILDCYASCGSGDQPCYTSCYSAHPNGQSAADPLDTCFQGVCASSCN